MSTEYKAEDIKECINELFNNTGKLSNFFCILITMAAKSRPEFLKDVISELYGIDAIEQKTARNMKLLIGLEQKILDMQNTINDLKERVIKHG